MPFDIGVLGEFTLRYGGERVAGPGVSRLPLLIACLALQRDHALPRCEAAVRLWPDSSEAQAHTNLRKALHYIKQTMPRGGPVRIEARTLGLQLGRGDRLDLLEFEGAVASAAKARGCGQDGAELRALASAVSAYGGDLLPGCDDDWLAAERQRLREAFIEAASRLIELLQSQNQHAQAIHLAQRLLRTDSLREETYRTLMRLHALNGDRAAALSTYHACASALNKGLGIDPDAATRGLYQRLLQDLSSGPRQESVAAASAQILVGRQREWDSLTAAWQGSAPGRPRLVLLSGEAGIGKTRLVEDFLEWARRQGLRAALATCYSSEGQASYAPVAAWLRHLPLERLDQRCLVEISRLVPELRQNEAPPPPITENWQKQAFHDSMTRAVLGEGDPCLIVLDDIHWCDADMLGWMRQLMRVGGAAKLVVLATLRTEELPSNPPLGDLVRDLRAADQIIQIELERLGHEDTTLLAAHLLGRQLSAADSALLFQESEGVPLFIVELARAGILGKGVPKKPDALPARLRAVVEGRLGHLTTPARVVAETAATLGREFSLNLLRRISELDEGTTMAALDELWRRRLVRERGGSLYDFSHDKLREVTLAAISPVRLRWLNQRAAEALEAADPSGAAARIAGHYERAGMEVQAAAHYAAAARRERGLFALNDALEHFTRAALFETDRTALASLHEERGDVLQLLERREQAREAYEQAFDLSEHHLQRARLAHKQMTVCSRFEPGVARECYRRALEEVEQAQGQPGYWGEWIATKFAAIEACYWQQNAAGLDHLLREVRAPVQRHGSLLQKIHFRHQVISGIFLRRRYRLSARDAAYARTSAAMARSANNPYLLASTIEAAALAAYCSNEMERAADGFAELIDLSAKLGDDNTLRIGRTYLSLSHRRMHHAAAVRLHTRLLAEELQRGSPNVAYQGIVEANLGWLAYIRGAAAEAMRHAQAALQAWHGAENPYPMQWCALIVLFALAVDARKLDEAVEWLREMLKPPQQRLLASVEAALTLAARPGRPSGRSRLPRLKHALATARLAGYI